MNRSRTLAAATAVLLSTLLAACLGGDASLGGSLSGLPASASITLQNNGADNLTLTANGSFWFAGSLEAGEAYAVTVLTQPAGANCTVSNGSGNINADGGDVSNVGVACTTTLSVSGTVTGLAAGAAVTLSNAGTTLLVGNGAFAFPGTAPAGTAYNVTVSVQPVNQTCTVTNGSGTVVSGTPTAVAVACSP